MARPKKEIDYGLIERLASIMCTEEEIASICDCDVRTLQRRPEFCRIYKKGQQQGKMSLRRKQWKLADNNATMAIWLGKQFLGQSDLGIIDDNTNENALLTLVNNLGKIKERNDGNEN